LSYCPSSYLAPCLGLLPAESKGEEVGDAYSYPTPGLVQDAADISVQTPKERTGGAERRSEHWNRLPREAGESPSLQIF